MNAVIGWAASRSRRVERVVEHGPTILVKHGRVLRENLRRERMSLSELRMALRKEGVISMRSLRYVILEEDGRVSVIRKPVAAA